jgi:two-component system OmpR family response regulator
MEPVPHILVVDDDGEIRSLLRAFLEREGLRVSTAPDGRGLWTALGQGRVDLIVLDLMLPGEDGLTLCRRLRVDSDVPVIMLTARGDPVDRIVGLEMGADDYLAKPFQPRELLARIRNVLRRVRAHAPPDTADARRLRFAGWTLDVGARELLAADGVRVPLSGAEYRLLRVFLDRPHRVLGREQLLDLARDRELQPFDRSIDVQVGRLRKRLNDDGREPRLLKTVRGEGYVFAADVEIER